MEVQDVKKLLLKLFFGGTPFDENPFLWGVCQEVRRVAAALVEMDKYMFVNREYHDRPNPLASRLARILFERENETLARLIASLKEKMGAVVDIIAYMFDGVIVMLQPRDETTVATLNDCLVDFSAKDIVKVIVKPWPTQ